MTEKNSLAPTIVYKTIKLANYKSHIFKINLAA